MKIVHISWVDSCCAHGWLDPVDVSPNPASCESVGFLVRETKEVVTVAMNRGLEGATAFGEYTTIPRACITKMKVLAKVPG